PVSAANSAAVRPLSRQRSTRFAHSSRPTPRRVVSVVFMHGTLPRRSHARHERGCPNAYPHMRPDHSSPSELGDPIEAYIQGAADMARLVSSPSELGDPIEARSRG